MSVSSFQTDREPSLWLQSEGQQAVTDGAAAYRDEDRAYVHRRELVSHPIIPSSPSTWDGSSVMSSPALSVYTPFPQSAPSPHEF